MKILHVFTILTSVFVLLVGCATHTPTERQSFSANESSSRRGMHHGRGSTFQKLSRNGDHPTKSLSRVQVEKYIHGSLMQLQQHFLMDVYEVEKGRYSQLSTYIPMKTELYITGHRTLDHG